MGPSTIATLEGVASQDDEWRLRVAAFLATHRNSDAELQGVVEDVDYPSVEQFTAIGALGEKGVALLEMVASRDAKALRNFSEEMKNTPSIVLTAVTQDGLALQFAHDSLRQDKEVVLAAVRQDWCALRYAHASLRQDFNH